MNNKKGEVSIGAVVIGTLIFFAVFIVFSHFYGDLRSNYDFNMVDDEGKVSNFYDSFQSYSDDVYGYTQEMSNLTEGAEHDTLENAVGYQLIVKGIWQAIILIFKFPAIFFVLIADFSVLIGIPTLLMSTILGIVIAFITFLVINAAMRWKT
jgi:hypothetical protein